MHAATAWRTGRHRAGTCCHGSLGKKFHFSTTVLEQSSHNSFFLLCNLRRLCGGLEDSMTPAPGDCAVAQAGVRHSSTQAPPQPCLSDSPRAAPPAACPNLVKPWCSYSSFKCHSREFIMSSPGKSTPAPHSALCPPAHSSPDAEQVGHEAAANCCVRCLP